MLGLCCFHFLYTLWAVSLICELMEPWTDGKNVDQDVIQTKVQGCKLVTRCLSMYHFYELLAFIWEFSAQLKGLAPKWHPLNADLQMAPFLSFLVLIILS